MATALAAGLKSKGLVAAENLWASDPVPEALEAFSTATGGNVSFANGDVLTKAETIFLAVKPHQLPQVCDRIAARLSEEHLVVSIAAGVPLEKLANWLGGGLRLVRVMPNTPCLVGVGASAFCLSDNCAPEDGEYVKLMLESVGLAYEVSEPLLDAVTGLSGSGPAFVYAVIEALSDGGVLAGLPRNIATKLAAQTVKGAAEMVLHTGQHPGTLKDQVTSPGGTTITGLAEIESGAVRASFMAAVLSATERARELGKSAS